MLILDWMTKEVFSVTPDTSLLVCSKRFKDHDVAAMPVVDENREVVGVVTAVAVRGHMPKAEISRDIVDVLESMERIKARDFMERPVTIDFRSTVPQAARVMLDKRIHFLAVVDGERKLVGVLTEWDLFLALDKISVGGVSGGVEMVCDIENKQGALRELLRQILDSGSRIASVHSTLSEGGAMREVLIHFWSEDPALESKALDSLHGHPGLRFWNHRGVVYLRDQLPTGS